LKFYFILWIMVATAALIYIFLFGVEYVNWPRLIPLTDAIDYDGPGKRSGRKGRGWNQFSSKYASHRGSIHLEAPIGVANGKPYEVGMGRKEHID
jgi:phosphatidylinositol 4-phosphatase